MEGALPPSWGGRGGLPRGRDAALKGRLPLGGALPHKATCCKGGSLPQKKPFALGEDPIDAS
eukprot:243122-Chlamydomonas_euryale.AAC.3